MRIGFFLREAFRSMSRNAVPSFAAMASVLVTVLVLGVFIPVVQATTGAAAVHVQSAHTDPGTPARISEAPRVIWGES